jgi:hypothetical protein
MRKESGSTLSKSQEKKKLPSDKWVMCSFFLMHSNLYLFVITGKWAAFLI